MKGVLAAPRTAEGAMSAVLEPIVGRCLALARIREGHPASVLAHPRLRRSPISRRAERCGDHRRFRALIGLQASAHAASYCDIEWLHHADVHGGEVCAGIVSGLVVAALVPGARCVIVPGLGHFPMSEDPERFFGHLRPVLNEAATSWPASSDICSRFSRPCRGLIYQIVDI